MNKSSLFPFSPHGYSIQQQHQHNDSIMPTLVDHIKPEIINPMPQQIVHQTHIGSAATQTTSTSSRGSKPQACVRNLSALVVSNSDLNGILQISEGLR